MSKPVVCQCRISKKFENITCNRKVQYIFIPITASDLKGYRMEVITTNNGNESEPMKEPSISENWQDSIKTNREKMAYILENQIGTNLTLKVGEQEEEINCHRIVLIMGSPFFESMLSDRWNSTGKGTNESISLPEIEPDVFWIILKFLYTEKFEIKDPSADICLSILELANVYFMSALRESCLKYFVQTQGLLNQDNAIRVFEESVRLSDEKLEKFALGKISDKSINSDDFLQLSHHSLCRFLKTKHISVPEIEIFEAASRWAGAQCTQNNSEASPENIRFILAEALHLIRFPIISPDNFATRVTPTGILSMEERMEILTYYSMDKECKRKIKKLTFFKTKPRIFYNTLTRFKNIGTDLFDYSANFRNLVFQVDRPILIYSLGFYGPDAADLPCEYNVELSLRENQNSEDWRRDPLVGSLVETVSLSNDEPKEVFHLEFAKPLQINADKEYLISFLLKGPKTRTGDSIQDVISMECGYLGKVTFNFKLAKYKNNRYQIPEICFALVD